MSEYVGLIPLAAAVAWLCGYLGAGVRVRQEVDRLFGTPGELAAAVEEVLRARAAAMEPDRVALAPLRRAIKTKRKGGRR